MSVETPSRVFAICGPTASGKSEIALGLAHPGHRDVDEAAPELEIVACDALQVYRGLDIGTAKPGADARRLVPHHCLDLVAPTEEFSAADYQRAARDAIAAITARGRAPLLVGGTGLYLRAAVDDLAFSAPPDPARRADLEAMPHDTLVAYLREHDPDRAARIDLANPRRVIRAVELYEDTGADAGPDPAWAARESIYDLTLVVVAPATREELYARIDARVEQMVDAGWLDEVADLRARVASSGGASLSRTAAAAIGYAELGDVIDGTRPLADAVEAIKARTRAYARRQLTWFRREPRAKWIEGTPDTAAAGVRRIFEEAEWISS